MHESLLVTGAAGFIGANFVHYWLERHPRTRLLAVDALTYAANPASLAGLDRFPGYRFEQADIRDQAHMTRLLHSAQVDCIVHFAAESHVDRSIDGPAAFIGSNIVGTHRLLEAARGYWLEASPQRTHRFHHVSTDEVYGDLGPADPAFSETTAYAPNSPYSASKAASDHLVRAYHHTYGLQVSTSNCSNNYGPLQFPEKLVALMITNALDGQALPVYGDGSNVRDWLYVSDHCRGIEAVLLRGQAGEVYNIGGNEEHSNLALVRQLCAMLDQAFADDPALARRFPQAPPAQGQSCESLLSFVPDRPGHDRRYAINAAKIRRQLGFTPSESFASGLRKCLHWYLENESWWRSVARGEHLAWRAAQAGHQQRIA